MIWHGYTLTFAIYLFNSPLSRYPEGHEVRYVFRRQSAFDYTPSLNLIIVSCGYQNEHGVSLLASQREERYRYLGTYMGVYVSTLHVLLDKIVFTVVLNLPSHFVSMTLHPSHITECTNTPAHTSNTTLICQYVTHNASLYTEHSWKQHFKCVLMETKERCCWEGVHTKHWLLLWTCSNPLLLWGRILNCFLTAVSECHFSVWMKPADGKWGYHANWCSYTEQWRCRWKIVLQ